MAISLLWVISVEYPAIRIYHAILLHFTAADDFRQPTNSSPAYSLLAH